MKFRIAIATLFFAGLALCSCNRQKPTDTSTSGMTSLMCDESFENIISQEIDVFEYTYPKASIIPFYVNENEAIDSLISFGTKLIIVPHELSQDKIEYFKSRKRNVRTMRIAVDAIAIIANKNNPIDELSVDELKNILIGKYTNWNDISPNKTGKISVVFDHQGSSTVKYMRDSVTNGQNFGQNVFAQKSNKQVFEVVKERKNAIGIIGVTWLSTDLDGSVANGVKIEDKVKELNQDQVNELQSESNNTFSKEIKVISIRRNDNPIAYKPYQYNIYTGDYPFYRSIYAITTSVNGSLPHGFYSFLTGVISQRIILGTGILPSVIPPRNVTLE